jgi:hypothetical protein
MAFISCWSGVEGGTDAFSGKCIKSFPPLLVVCRASAKCPPAGYEVVVCTCREKHSVFLCCITFIGWLVELGFRVLGIFALAENDDDGDRRKKVNTIQ